jgi:hypothetical protein
MPSMMLSGSNDGHNWELDCGLPNFFNISLHRSGTQSTHDLFRRSGVSAVHWPADVDGVDYQARIVGRETDLDAVAEALEPVFDTYVAISDAPIPALYRQLAERRPDSRFFALIRPGDAWIASVRRHIGDRALVPFEQVVYWSYFQSRPTHISHLSDDDLRSFHEWHHRSITDFFADAENFLILPLDACGLGAALCDFCGLPALPFRQFDYAMGHDLGRQPDEVAARITE